MPHIEELPLEIYFSIYDYLAPLPPPTEKIYTHPFFALSRTSKTFRNTLIPFLRLQILTSKVPSLAKYQDSLTDAKRGLSRLTPKLLKLWLTATMKHCFSCGKASSRRAIMDSTVVCCVKCDRVCWPDKITMSEAIKKYSIKKEDLFGGVLPSTLGGPVEQGITKNGIIPQRKGLHYGQFTQNNTFTTMFMEDDVRRLACQKHGIDDMETYLSSKSDRAEFRRAKMEENRRKKRNYIRRLAEKNGLEPSASLKRFEYRQFEHRKCTPMIWARGDLLLKKLGIAYVDNYPDAPFYSHLDMVPSDSKCYALLTRLMGANLFTKFSAWEHRKALEWGGEDCRFKRIMYLIKSNNPKRKGQYVYKKNLREDPDEDLDQEDDVMDDHSLGTAGYGRVEITPIGDAEINGIPVKNFHSDFDRDLEQMVYCRKGYTGEIYQWVVYDRKWKLNPVGISEWADPIDYCLFEAFIEEFSTEGVPPPTLTYAELRDIWKAREVEKGGELPVEECRAFTTPWSWLRYPVCIQDVTLDDYSEPNPPAPTYTHHPALRVYVPPPNAPPFTPPPPGPRARQFIEAAKLQIERMQQEDKDREQREWDDRRAKEESKMDARNLAALESVKKVEDAIKAVVVRYGWDLLGQDGGEAWERAVEEEMAGGGYKVKGKGKEKERAEGSSKPRATRARKGKEIAESAE